jgi:hypothetical protein
VVFGPSFVSVALVLFRLVACSGVNSRFSTWAGTEFSRTRHMPDCTGTAAQHQHQWVAFTSPNLLLQDVAGHSESFRKMHWHCSLIYRHFEFVCRRTGPEPQF